MNAYLEEIPSDTEYQETAPIPADEIMDIIYRSMSTTWKNKLIEQGFNYIDSTIKEMSDFFETRVENLEPKEDRNNLQQLPRKALRKLRKGKEKTPIYIVVESSEESTKAYRPSKKYCILHGKCSHSTESCKDLHAMVNKHYLYTNILFQFICHHYVTLFHK